MKKLIFFLLSLSLLLSACGSQAPDSPTDAAETAVAFAATQIGNSTYSCITGESETHETSTEGSTVYVKAFAHQIYNSEKDYMVTLTSTVTASKTDSEITLTNITGALTDAQSDGLTVSEHLSGDIGTVVLYLNQMSVCHFQYRVSLDGSFELLSA